MSWGVAAQPQGLHPARGSTLTAASPDLGQSPSLSEVAESSMPARAKQGQAYSPPYI